MPLSHSSPLFKHCSHLLFLPSRRRYSARLDPASHSHAPHPITTSQLNALTPRLPLCCGQKGPVTQESRCLRRISQSLASSVETGLGGHGPLEDRTGLSARTLYCPMVVHGSLAAGPPSAAPLQGTPNEMGRVCVRTCDLRQCGPDLEPKAGGSEP